MGFFGDLINAFLDSELKRKKISRLGMLNIIMTSLRNAINIVPLVYTKMNVEIMVNSGVSIRGMSKIKRV